MTANKSNFELVSWEKGTLIVLIILLLTILSLDFFPNWIKSDYQTLLSILISLFTGIIAAISVLALERYHRKKKLLSHYSEIEGEYTRIEIGQDNTPYEKQETLRSENNGLKVQLEYLGGNSFKVDMELWKSINAKAAGIIEFNETNKVVGSGNYKYYQGENHVNHFGTFQVYWFKEEKNRLYVLYNHVYPRSELNNPDKNRGWQIWEK